MRKRTKVSYILIAALFIFGLFVLYLTKNWPKTSYESGFGPGFYPDLLVIVLFILLAVLFFQEWTADRKYRRAKTGSPTKADDGRMDEASDEEENDDEIGFKSDRIKMPAIFMGMMAIYTALMNTMGFVLDTVLFLFFGMLIMKARPLPSIMITVLFTAFLYFVFGALLKVQLPAGVLFGG